MKDDCHIFLKYLVFQIKKLVLRSEALSFDRKIRYFRFEILGCLHIEFEILGISGKISSISKKVLNPGFNEDPMYIL